jgi:cyclase
MKTHGSYGMQSGTDLVDRNPEESVRIIARLDIKGPNLIKAIRLEGLRVLGPPNDFALKYYQDGIDELIFIDCVASLYGRNHLSTVIESAARSIFVPITVGGGIRTLEDAKEILRFGADKVAINTQAVKTPGIVTQVSEKFGSQCMVLSIEAKKIGENRWEVYVDGGRERTGMDVIDWAVKGVQLGAGEILLTSVDHEGTRLGFDLDLVRSVSSVVPVPVIASGGMGKFSDFRDVVWTGGASAVAIADMLHYKRCEVNDVREYASTVNIKVRKSPND